jgi:hypothetical protein
VFRQALPLAARIKADLPDRRNALTDFISIQVCCFLQMDRMPNIAIQQPCVSFAEAHGK